MSWFTADYWCDACLERFDLIIRRVDRGTPQPCPSCGAACPEVPGAPLVSKAAFTEAAPRRDGYQDLVRVNRLEGQLERTPPGDRDGRRDLVSEIEGRRKAAGRRMEANNDQVHPGVKTRGA